MHIQDHPLYEEWCEAFQKLQDAHRQLDDELRKGERGLVDAAKLDLKKAQDDYDDISARV